MIKTTRVFRVVVALCAFACSPVALAEELVSLTSTRSDVTLKLLMLPVDKPVAVVILFAGGHGAIRLSGSADGPSIG